MLAKKGEDRASLGENRKGKNKIEDAQMKSERAKRVNETQMSKTKDKKRKAKANKVGNGKGGKMS